jgi:spore germination cell wall hydrolase CwlJ-like protein
MTAMLGGGRGKNGGHRSVRGALKAATWACLAGAALTINIAALAEPITGSAAGKTDRFLRPQVSRLPMWTPVEPGKAEIFRKPTRAAAAEEIRCLALNIYFEARGEPESGQLAVGHVVMNRVASSRFPGTVCGVIQQGGALRRYRCQFSWWCDGRSDKPGNKRLWERSAELALKVYWGRTADPTGGALWYHADYVNPAWGKTYERGPKIGRHIFYSQGPGGTQVANRNRKN